MLQDIPAVKDLTLIFERDDIHAAFALHCFDRHDPGDVSCKRCSLFRALLANAILEWFAMTQQDGVRTMADVFKGERE